MHYPDIDPILFELGPLAIRWYGLAYLAAFASAWWLGRWRGQRPQLLQPNERWSSDDVADLVFYAAVGGVLGGRLGYCLVYAFDAWLREPLFVFQIWQGGMSIHGGILGAVVALLWFAARQGRPMLQVTDFAAPCVPLGLGLGRLGNFANTELPGRATDSAFGMIYPCAAGAVARINPTCTGVWESFARHPSPLYQAAAEGLVLFACIWLLGRQRRQVGVLSGAFVCLYGVVRFAVEYFREPDAAIGFVDVAWGGGVSANWLTMGQLLSLPMVIIGMLLVLFAVRRNSA